MRTQYTPRLTLRAKLIAAAYIAEALYWLAACAWVEPALHYGGYGMDAGLGPCAPTRSTAWRRQASRLSDPTCLPFVSSFFLLEFLPVRLTSCLWGCSA
jgi:hypothetical protein